MYTSTVNAVLDGQRATQSIIWTSQFGPRNTMTLALKCSSREWGMAETNDVCL